MTRYASAAWCTLAPRRAAGSCRHGAVTIEELGNVRRVNGLRLNYASNNSGALKLLPPMNVHLP